MRPHAVRGVLVLTLAASAALAPAAPAAGAEIHKGVVYKATSHVKVRMDIYVPSGRGPFPSVVVIHGGTWRNGSRSEFVQEGKDLARAGFVAFVADYRMACKPRNLKPETIDPKLCGYRFPVPIEDLGDAVQWVRSHAKQYRARSDKVGVVGSSSGGNLAMMVGVVGTKGGTRADVVVSWSGLGNLLLVSLEGHNHRENYIGCAIARCPDKWGQASPSLHVTPGDAPLYLSGSSNDQNDPLVDQVQAIATWRGNLIPTEWHLVMGSGCHARHCIYQYPKIWDESVAWLHKWLDGQGSLSPLGYANPL
jgi:acetyl esterase/lipase